MLFSPPPSMQATPYISYGVGRLGKKTQEEKKQEKKQINRRKKNRKK
jgi:hypothetical protein